MRVSVSLVAVLAFLSAGPQSVAAVAPPPAFQTLTHLGVKASNLVDIDILFTPGPGPSAVGWRVFRGDGSITDYDAATNPLVAPAGQVLVVTDILDDTRTTANATFCLSVSRTVDGTTVSLRVYCAGGEGAFATVFHDYMTTGIVVPSGWQLDLPEASGGVHIEDGVRLKGYFASAQ